MLNFAPDLVDSRSLQNNQHAIERHVDFDHYVRSFTPGMFLSADAGATFVTVIAATMRWPAIEYADAATSRAHVSWRKPSEWRTGHLRIRFWYTSPVGDANRFRVQLLVSTIRDTEVLTGTLLADVSASYSGPAVANTVIRSPYVYTTTTLGSDDELFSLRVARVGGDAADTNVNVLQVLFAEVEHIPALQVSQ